MSKQVKRRWRTDCLAKLWMGRSMLAVQGKGARLPNETLLEEDSKDQIGQGQPAYLSLIHI